MRSQVPAAHRVEPSPRGRRIPPYAARRRERARGAGAIPRHGGRELAVMRRLHLLLAAGFALVAARAALAGDPPSEETIAYFKQNCASCHTIGGGKLTGPDLKNVGTRRTREQLAKYVIDPKAAIDSGDPYLVKIWNEANGVYMPTPPGITPERVQKLLDLIEAESALEKSQFAG